MDLSTHTDTHQQQQYQQFQQPQQIASQAYDPSQVQPYDQSYYTYPHQYDQQQAAQQQYPYYPSDYTNIYQHQQPQHHEPTSIHPPGVPIPPETTAHLVAPEYGQTHLQNQQNAYYPQGVVEQQNQQLSNSDSAFPQWQGNGGGFGPMPVHNGSGSMPPPIGQYPYRGGGRRGGRPFRGGGRGGSGPPFRGRGRGRGGGRFTPAEGPAASGPGQAPFPTPAQVHATPVWPPPRMAWCELCRVDCNTSEILEQHKNGKRHKKNLQVYEELQNLNKLITGMQNPQMPISEFNPEVAIQPERVEGFEGKQPHPENLPSEAAAGDNRFETGQQKESVDKSNVSVAEMTEEPERKPRMDHYEARGRGFKRMMRGGPGGKRIRTNEWPRRPVEPPKPKQVIPLICELCNVKCDSQVVFDSHLSGKKHLSNLRRFHGYQAILGAVVLQALCQPNPNAPSTSFIPQVLQPVVQGPEGFSSQPMPYMLPQGPAPEIAPEPTPAPVPFLETHNQPDSELHVSQSIIEAKSQNSATVGTKSQLESVKAEVESQPAVTNDTKTENGISVLQGKEASLPQDNAVMAPSDTIVSGAEQVLSATATGKAVVIPKCEVDSSAQGVLSGLDCKIEEPEIKNE
ncbi:hypothetical protein L1049_018631 [Liquidambar formosana]|uniref:U1-type domain-containing protein n=1 Tax=Liquidambar formosana TaxID=63359 RepID=A0AAP0WNJ4_LIQFO